MAFVPIGFAECSLRYQLGSFDDIFNVFGVITGPDWDVNAEGEAIADACSQLRTVLSNDIQMLDLYIKTGDGIEASFLINQLGVVDAGSVPPQVCGYIRKLSGFIGRHNRGAWYLPGMPEEQVTGAGFLDPAYLLDVTDAFQQLLVDLATNDTAMVILGSTEDDSPVAVSQMVVRGKVATQKRRLVLG